MKFTSDARTILTVEELNQQARDLLESHFGYFWLRGEISNFSCPSSGHWYFSLKDSQSQIRAAFFKNSQRGLTFRPENGVEVLVRARLSLYVPRGDYQIIVEQMECAGDGLLRHAFEQLKIKLSAEGLFDEKYKKPLPEYPQHIAVITSSSGAVIHDIVQVLQRRSPSIAIEIIPVAVQGKTSAQEIAQALIKANQRQGYELIILARGGGALEDLQSFNDEAVARAIFHSAIPVITGVGHQTDFTIADFVADVRAPTPSAAAELISSHQADIVKLLHQQESKLIQQINYLLAYYQQSIQHLLRRLKHPRRTLEEAHQKLDEKNSRLILAQQWLLQKTQQRWLALSQRLNTVSPLATLERGYSMTFNQQGQLIRAAEQTCVGDILHTRLFKGELACEVKAIQLMTADITDIQPN